MLDGGVGVTIASSSRFFATIKCLVNGKSNTSHSKELRIVIDSPQFHTQFIFAYHFDNFSLTLLSKTGNEFIEKCLSLFFAFAKVHFGVSKFIYLLSAIASTGELGIKLRADNDFYSQVDHLRSLGKPLRSASLRALPRFNPCPLDPVSGRPMVVKTGMGSSAAMTTALVASLLHYFGIIRLPAAEATSTASSAEQKNAGVPSEDKALLHNLAQLAHAIAQGKIGSGFDVAAAVYGTYH